MELELKHIAPYLPYGLNLQFSYEDDTEQNIKRGLLTDVYTIDDDVKLSVEHMDDEHIWMFKPILRPLSEFCEDLELNGELIDPPTYVFGQDIFEGFQDGQVNALKDLNMEACYDWSMWSKLFEMHFDVFNLIPQGLAVDSTTLK